MKLFPASLVVLTVSTLGRLAAQQYVATNATGQLQRTAVVNLLQQAQQVPAQFSQLKATTPGVEKPAPVLPKQLHPPVAPRVSAHASIQAAQRVAALAATQASPPMSSLPIGSVPSTFGFNGLTHAQQRLANGGNQFSVEPPNPSIAVANGFILEGVNNAVHGGSPIAS